MTTLSDALASLADASVVEPTPIDVIQRRSQQLRRSRRLRLLAGATAIAVAVAAPIALNATRTNRGIDVTTASPVEVRNGGYIATGPGGYVGSGHWSLTIYRGQTVIALRSEDGAPCGPTGTIQPGDRVYGNVAGAGSALRAGETAHC